MGIKAYRSSTGGAWRLWVIARSITKDGWLSKSDLKQEVLQHSSERNYNRWLRSAIDNHFLLDRGERVKISNPAKVAYKLGLKDVGKPVLLEIDSLFKAGWRSTVFSGIHNSYAKMMSRRTIERITEVPQRSQARHDNRAGVRRRKNWKRIKTSARFGDLDAIVREHQQKGRPVIVSRAKGKAPFIRERLPDSRESSLDLARRGRTESVSLLLDLLNSQSRSNGSTTEAPQRLFYEAKASFMYKLLRLAAKPIEVFQFAKAERNGNLWNLYSSSNAY